MVRVASAGVLCFSRRSDGKLVILLGREKETLGWKQGSNKWSSFSGRVEPGEDVEDGAAREFVEESLAVVAIDQSMPIPARVADVSQTLRVTGNRVEIQMLSRDQTTGAATEDPPRPVVLHVSFVQRVPYADYPARFRALRTLLVECDTRFRTYHRTKKAAEHLPRLLFPGYHFSTTLTVVNGIVQRNVGGSGGATVELSIWDDVACALVHQHICLSGEAAREVNEVYEAWADVLAYIERNKNHHALSHPAVSIQRVNRYVVGAYVNKCYLEKSEVRWWGLEELERTGKQRPHEFRRFFSDALAQLIAAVHSVASTPAAASDPPSINDDQPPRKKDDDDSTSSVSPPANQTDNKTCSTTTWHYHHHNYYQATTPGRSWDNSNNSFYRRGGGKQ